MQPSSPPPRKSAFNLVTALGAGARLAYRNAPLLTLMSVFPFVLTFATLVAQRIIGDMSPFWLPIIHLPASFVTGLLSMLVLRMLMFGEYPMIADAETRKARNAAVMRGAIVFTAVTFFMRGAGAALIVIHHLLTTAQEAMAPYTPLVMAGLVLLFWSLRWLWLHVPVVLEWPVRPFYALVGRWSGSLMIFAIFAITTICVDLVTVLARNIVAVIGHAVSGNPPASIFMAFDDAIVAMAMVVFAVVFACVTAVAVREMTGMKDKTEQE